MFLFNKKTICAQIMSRLRNFCFTFNNYPEDYISIIKQIPYVRYYIIGKEVGEKGTPHLQGYVQLQHKVSFKKIKSILTKCHIESAKGSATENIDYCSKDGDYETFGTPKKQGERKDLSELKEAILEGKSEYDCMLNYSAAWRYNKAMSKFKFLKDSKDRGFDEMTVKVIVGSPGAGKSRLARTLDPYLYQLPDNLGNWFDGYLDEETLLIEDFEGEMPYRKLLKLLDGYRFAVPIKGGYVWKKWKNVIITTNIPVLDWYNISDISALRRRITEFVHLPISDC